MKEFAGQLKSSSYRMRHSLFYLAHVLIPAAGVLLYFLYTLVRPAGLEGHLTAYMTLLAMAYPAVAGVVTAMVTEREARAGGMQNILMAPSRTRVLSCELVLLLLAGLLAAAIAVFGFGMVMSLAGYGTIDSGKYICLTFILWAGNFPVYLVHLFLGIRFGEGLTMGVGVAETVISAVMFTGLGDGVWYYWWPSYGMRFSTLYLTAKSEGMGKIFNEFTLGGICYLVISVVFLMSIFLWFERFQGRKEEV